MKTISFFVLLCLLAACSGNRGQSPEEQIAGEIEAGNFTLASHMIDSLITHQEMTDERKEAYLFTIDSLHRVKLDFNKSREDIISWIQERHQFTPTGGQLDEWEAAKSLEYRIIDGEKRYFRNAAANLFRVDSEAKKLSQAAATTAESGTKRILDTHLTQLTPAGIKGKYLLPKIPMQVKYTLTVAPDVVEEGEIVRGWLPYPRKDIHRQTGVRFIGTSQADYILSEDKTGHTSVYMEQKAREGEPVVFSVEYAFSSQGEWFDLSQLTPQPYQTDTEEYQKYTSERFPHIRFSERIKSLTDSVTQGVETPVETLQSIYRYITATYPWASALEYSTITNIPEYVIENGKGDCGQVTLLLITMLRYKGVPARWQSGWMTHPGEVNLHDWAEVWFEGVGWVPVDVSFGRGEPLENETGREFFMSGIDSYRLYVNSDYSDEFFPKKKYPRSETVDFQRGEVEADSWNLYFDKWKYRMDVAYK
jgi:Transglutaminase-like enzymes, putative cysteine proteases